MIKFLGIGSAFNTSLGNTSAFIKEDKTIVLFDCGGTVFHKIREFNLLNGIEKINIIITHTHPDHVGSLGEVIFYCHYILKIKPIIHFPMKETLTTLLKIMGVTEKMYDICCDGVYKDGDKMSLEFVKTTHVDTLDSFSVVMKRKNDCFYYSGDSNDIADEILNRMYSGEIERIYQDTCGLDYDGNAHMYIGKLEAKIKLEYRKKIFCMHLDEHIDKEDIKKMGFNVAVIA